MIEIAPDRFEEMVTTAFGRAAAALGRVMRNVAVVVDNDSTQRHLLGLYEGVPLTERTHTYSAVLPDRITIYRQAICAICSTEDQVVEEVRRTVIHEVGHHFGIDDDAPARTGLVARQLDRLVETSTPDHEHGPEPGAGPCRASPDSGGRWCSQTAAISAAPGVSNRIARLTTVALVERSTTLNRLCPSSCAHT